MSSYPTLIDGVHRTAGAGTLVAAPTGYVLASPAALPTAVTGPFTRLGLAVLRADPATGPVVRRFAIGLLDIHQRVLHETLGFVVRRLESRTSGAATLLDKQLVQGQLAEIALRLFDDDPVGWAGSDRAARWRTHRRQVGTGRRLLRFLGASGFVATAPAVDLYLAEAAGNVYLHPEAGDPDD